jgi:hypothetical protein
VRAAWWCTDQFKDLFCVLLGLASFVTVSRLGLIVSRLELRRSGSAVDMTKFYCLGLVKHTIELPVHRFNRI